MPYITVVDTVFQGRVAGWRDEDGRPVVYDTEQEAELDAHDVMDDDEPDGILEVVVTDDKIYDPVNNEVYWTLGEKK